jgi:hypothetical protein
MTDKGLTLEAYCSSWLCKEHRPKKVHHFTKERLEREAKGIVKVKVDKVKKEGKGKRRGRAANPEFANLPKGYTCCVEGCGFFQLTHHTLVKKAAEAKGVSVEDLYKNWKCKAHRKS